MDARGRDSVSGASSLGPDSLVFRRGGARHENLNHGLMFYNAIKFFACKRRSKSLGVIWWRLQWRRRWEKKKKSCSVLGRPPRKSGTNSEIRIQYRIILLPFPVFVTRLWVSHSSAITRTKKTKRKRKRKFYEAGELPRSPTGEKKSFGAFWHWENCCLTDLWLL